MKKKTTKRQPTKQDIKLALAKLKRIEKLKDQISALKEKLKDQISALKEKLRDELSDVEDICNSLEYGEEQIDSGLREIQSGLDTMSQLL